MREGQQAGNPAAEAVALQALRYASGELDEAAAAAFERRLGDDQSAREALCQAVNQCRTLTEQPVLPNPSYRAEVRRQLRRPGWWEGIFRRRAYHGHPLLWGVLGAAAAMALTLSPAGVPTSLPPQPLPSPPAQARAEEAVDPPAIEEPPEAATTEDEAASWAALHSTNRVAKAHDEEMRRRQRSEDRHRLIRPPEGRPRVLGNTSPDHR
jgi:hypothetical protein